MKKVILSFFLAILSVMLFSQETNKNSFTIIDLGIEFQIYPTGIMPGLRIETNLSQKDAINLRIGMNFFDHKDFPKKAGINKHDSEIGYGYGFSLGYRHYFWKGLKNLYFGVRSDLWFNKVYWSKKNPDFYYCDSSQPCLQYVPNPTIKGESNIVVLQPTIEAGWLFEMGKNKNIFIAPDIAFGYEWNAIVKGEQTGYGFIFLAGISAGYRFNKIKK